MNDIGHNQPPDMAATAGETVQDLSGWMAENPVIQTEEQAREAKVFIDRGSLCVKDLEDERTGKVRPLNEQVNKINDYYRGPRILLERVVDELKSRMDKFLLAEEAKRLAVAEEAARLAEQAERVAREAERLEREAVEAASAGELGQNIAARTAEANEAYNAYQKAQRASALAEKETKVRIGGGFTRAMSLHERDVLTIENMTLAVTAIGLTEDIKKAILKGARAFKKLHGRYPVGISVAVEKKT